MFHLAEHLQAIGPALPGGMGPVPITFAELSAWQAATGHRLQPWEAQAIHHASRAYVSSYAEGSEAGTPPPWIDPAAVRAGMNNSIKAAFSKG